jgi:hypothetical protein
MGRLIALIVALVAGALIAWQGERVPDPAPTSAPPAAFSAMRAMRDVEVIAARPHPLGSPENQAVRDYLVGRLRGLGLETSVRRGSAIHHRERRGDLLVEGATVENIIGVLPGRDRSLPAVALMAHYDSVANSPGAADDAAGVAAALEIVRAMQARGAPARDVMLVLTDGEESGLFGARAFFERDPMARRIGFVVNMEARGNGGRVQMFETGRGNGESVALYQRVVADPSAASLSSFIYEQMPNGTDFTLPKDAGLQGLNFAFIGRQFDYHSPTSTPANLEKGSLQDMGDQVLAVAGAAAHAPRLPARTPDAVYSQVPGGLMIGYPTWAGWIVLAASAALIALAALRARRAEGFSPWDAARGACALLFAMLGAAALLTLARKATGAGPGYFEQSYLLAQAPRWEAAVLLLGLGFLILAAATASRGRRLVAALPALAGVGAFLLDRAEVVTLAVGFAAAALGLFAYWQPSRRQGAWTGVLALGLVLGVTLQAVAPTTAYIVAWPLLAAAVAAAATDMSTRKGWPALAVLAVITAAVLGFAGGYAHASYLSLDLMALQALPILMAALALWPLAQPAEGAPPARLLGPALLIAGAAVTLWVRLDAPWSARHPQLSYVQYHVDQDAGRAWRISFAPTGGAWSQSALTADGGSIAKRTHWLERRPFDAAPAQMVSEAPPQISVTRLPDGRLSLRATPPPGARLLALQVRPSTAAEIVSLAELQQTLAMKPGRWSRIWWEGEPAGVEITFRAPPGGALDVRYAATLERWPSDAKPLPSRPPDVGPFHTSDSTVLTGTRRFTW